MGIRFSALFALLLLLCGTAQGQFEILNLGAPGSGINSFAHRINNHGEIIVSTNSESLFWIRSADGTYTPAGVPDGYTRSGLGGINDSGFTVGSVSTGTSSSSITRAVIRSPSGDFNFPLPQNTGAATDINDVGDVVGTQSDTNPSRGFLYRPGLPVIFISKPPGTPTQASATPIAVNNSGMVVGETSVFVNSQSIIRGFRWSTSGGSVLLPTLNDEPGLVADMNDAGVIVGTIGGLGGPVRAVKWLADDTIVQLGAPSPTGFIAPNAINTRGDVVGSGFLAGPRAVLWADDFGSVDLNDLLTPEQQFHWNLRVAHDINDHRQIVGVGLFDPDGPAGPEPAVTRAFLLTVPEPATAVMSLPVLFPMIRRRRRAHHRSLPMISSAIVKV